MIIFLQKLSHLAMVLYRILIPIHIKMNQYQVVALRKENLIQIHTKQFLNSVRVIDKHQ